MRNERGTQYQANLSVQVNSIDTGRRVHLGLTALGNATKRCELLLTSEPVNDAVTQTKG
jgi:hypothetical protein